MIGGRRSGRIGLQDNLDVTYFRLLRISLAMMTR